MVGPLDDNQVAVLEEALTRFHQAQIQGEQPDIDRFAAQYPQVQDQLRQRLQDLQEIDSLFDSLFHADASDLDSTAVTPELVGRKLASFEVEKIIGRGGMGVVYLARDTKLKRHVAIKSLPPGILADPVTQSRFRREAEVLASLNHPNIAVIYDIIEDGSQVAYLILEYVPGESLAARIAKGSLRLQEALAIGLQIAEAVSVAHEKNVIHRDLKPGNIKITPDGRVKVLDFGLAKAIERKDVGDQTTATHPGRLMGTPAYMSPEQIRGRSVNHRTDIWAFGCILYEMLTGQRPFEGETVSDTIARTLEREPDLEFLPEHIPQNIVELIRRCLAKDPDKRLQNISDALSQIRQAQHLIASGSSVRPKYQIAVKARFLRPVIMAASVLLIVTFAVIVRPLWQGKSASVTQEKYLVVLPFDNLGPPEDDTFVAGMTGAITARLAGVQGLAVISRNSAIQYTSTDRNIQEIGKQLDVDYVLEGTVQREFPKDPTSRLRIIPALVRVSDDKLMWAETYDSNMTEVFRIQSDLAERVARSLDIAVLSPERQALISHPTKNLEAYDYYLRGNTYMERGCGQEENARFALQMFQKAVELDPQFALAYAMLTEVHLAMFFYRHDRSEARLASAKQAVDAAVSLAPDLPEVHKALGIYYYWGLLDYDRALQECALALKSRPNESILFVFVGAVQRRRGKWDEALVNFEKAAKLDPRSSLSAQCLADTSAILRDYPQANRHFERAISLSPDLTLFYARHIKMLLSWKGNTKAAREVLNKAREHVDIYKDDLLTYNAILLDIFDGEYAAARKLLAGFPAEVLETQLFFVPKTLLYAQISDLEGDQSSAHEFYDTARLFLEAEIQKDPNDAFRHSALGIAYAGLGKKSEAIREGQLAVELLPVAKEAWVGLWRLEDLARIYVMVGEYDLATEQIEYLLSIPGEISIPLLQLDPFWNPLRNHPRFQKLIESNN